MPAMIPFEEAYRIIQSVEIPGFEKEIVTLNNSLGRVLANDIHSDMDMPPFDKAAMDGYACRKSDIQKPLELIETIPAGKKPEKFLNKGQCSKIMTGGMMPQGADCIIIVEHTEQLPDGKIKYLKDQTGTNICYKGEDLQIGAKVLSTGTIIKAQHIAELASVGGASLPVVKKTKIGVISTGNEIVEPKEKPLPSQIRNSNAYQLIAQITECGVIANYFGIVEDTKAHTEKAISEALESNDIVISTGAVSMGDFDLIPIVLKAMGFEIHFHHIAVKPGKPTLFAQKDDKFFFGLPGNPVSSFVQFALLVKPFIYRLMFADYKQASVFLPLNKDYIRRKTKRKSWMPVKIINNCEAMLVEYHGSAHIYSLTAADGIIDIEIGKNTIKKGELVNVRLF